MRTTKEHFGKRPNWILTHEVMRGNAYNQAIYTHLRGMNPYMRWRSVRFLAENIAQETGFTESVCRKALTALKSAGFFTLNDSGAILFGSQRAVKALTKPGYTGNQSGYTGSQSGYTGNQTTTSEQGFLEHIDNRDIEKVVVETHNGTGTNVPVPFLKTANDVHFQTEEDVILGADPSPPSPPQRTAPKKPSTKDIIHFFNYAATRAHAPTITTQEDIIVFSSQIKKALSAGHTLESLREMIHAFFQFDRHKEHPCPWKVFLSDKVFSELQSSVAGISVEDPVLRWIHEDFRRTDPLPWGEDFDELFESAVYRRGMSLLFRYADLVASVAIASGGEIELAKDLLDTASTALSSHLNGESATGELALLQQQGVVIPHDFSRSKIRKECKTVQESVLMALRKSQNHKGAPAW